MLDIDSQVQGGAGEMFREVLRGSVRRIICKLMAAEVTQLPVAEAQAPFLENYDATHWDANTRQSKHRKELGYAK